MNPHPNDTIERILAGVCQTYEVSRMQLVSKQRSRPIVLARDAACVALRTLTVMSTPEIARVVGFNSHTCVLSALKRAEERQRAARMGLIEPPAGPDDPADHSVGANKMVPAQRRVELLRIRFQRRADA